MEKTIQELYEEDFLTFAGACSELGLPMSQALPPAGTENHNAVRLHIAEKWYETQFGPVIGRDHYLIAIADLTKAGTLKTNPAPARPSGVGVMFRDSEDAKNNGIPDSAFVDPREIHNKSVNEAQALRERRAMQVAGQIETPRLPSDAIPGLKSESEQVNTGGRLNYAATERLQKANREHNERLRVEYAANKGEK